MQLHVGQLSLDQINLIFGHLPVEVTFVDEDDIIRYYSRPKVETFPRSPDIIGKTVQECHPAEVLDEVNRMMAAFKDGSRDVAEAWSDSDDNRFIHTSYFAVRDLDGNYRGTLEVTQNATGIRKLEGQKKSLEEF